MGNESPKVLSVSQSVSERVNQIKEHKAAVSQLTQAICCSILQAGTCQILNSA